MSMKAKGEEGKTGLEEGLVGNEGERMDRDLCRKIGCEGRQK